jgi:hypothetical protein
MTGTGKIKNTVACPLFLRSIPYEFSLYGFEKLTPYDIKLPSAALSTTRWA